MDTESAKKLLTILVQNSSRILLAGFGVNHAESALFSVISLLKSEPQLKAEFLTRIGLMLEKDDPYYTEIDSITIELVELVAHELRWNELRQLAEDKIATANSNIYEANVIAVCNRILSAFEDDWEDREFYKHYSR